MSYYQKDKFKLWLDENRKSDSVKYLGYVTSIRKKFFEKQAVVIGKNKH